MKETAPDLHTCLPRILRSLFDDAGNAGEQYTASLSNFEKYCDVLLVPEDGWTCENAHQAAAQARGIKVFEWRGGIGRVADMHLERS